MWIDLSERAWHSRSLRIKLMPIRQHLPMRSHFTNGWTAWPALQINCLFSRPSFCFCNGPRMTVALASGMEAMHKPTIWTLPYWTLSWLNMSLLSSHHQYQKWRLYPGYGIISLRAEEVSNRQQFECWHPNSAVPGFYHRHCYWGAPFDRSRTTVNPDL